MLEANTAYFVKDGEYLKVRPDKFDGIVITDENGEIRVPKIHGKKFQYRAAVPENIESS